VTFKAPAVQPRRNVDQLHTMVAGGPLPINASNPAASPLHFCYAQSNDYVSTELSQGDVLRRTPELDKVLATVHPHFHQHRKNLYFMVLTQSCDLVIRDGEAGKAPYVNIAPVRPLDEVIAREIDSLRLQNIRGELPLLTHKARARLSDFARRLINNNVPQYFFLESDGTELGQDCCAFLRLSIAIKSDLHYKTCVDAKFLQLNDSFQAKLGALVGQLYSRVGTKDWDAKQLESKVAQLTKDAAYYLDDGKVKELEREFAARCATDADFTFEASDLTAAIKAIPTKKKVVVSRAADIAAQLLKLDDAAKAKLQGRLQADPTLNRELGG
jgi:hypothetical protein